MTSKFSLDDVGNATAATSTSNNNDNNINDDDDDGFDDFLKSMDKEREAINARIMSAYADNSNNNNDNDDSGEDNNNNDNQEVQVGSSSSSESLLISNHGNDHDSDDYCGNNDNNGSMTELPSLDNNFEEIVANNYSNNSNNSSVKKVIHNDNSTDNNISSSNSGGSVNVRNNAQEKEEDEVYKITRQSQQLYDKLKLSTSYTMTTHNTGSSLTTTSYNSPGATMSTTATDEVATDVESNTVMDHDVHTAGSKESYDWVLQQLSSPKKKVECHEVKSKKEGGENKKEIFVGDNVDAAAVKKSTTSVASEDNDDTTCNNATTNNVTTTTANLEQMPKEPKDWFIERNNNNRVVTLLKVNSHQEQTTAAGATAAEGGGMTKRGNDNILFPTVSKNDNYNTNNQKRVVLVNPNIFNKNDIHTAKNLISQVVQSHNISSTVEDWARQFEFDDVVGISGGGDVGVGGCFDLMIEEEGGDNGVGSAAGENSNGSLTLLTEQLAVEASSSSSGSNSKCSTVLCAVGGTKSGKTTLVFGPVISNIIASSTATTSSATTRMENSTVSNLGMVGEIIQTVLQHNNNQCSISILEIADDDVMRDVLGFSEDGLNEQNGTSALRLRHGDHKKRRGVGGVSSSSASVENLWQVPITSIEEACEIIPEAFQSRALRRIWREEGGHGHFVVTISCNNRDYEGEEGSSSIQVVDLASPDRQAAGAASSSPSRVSSIRKSLSTLRGILRELAINQPQSLSSPPSSPLSVSFRECTLTKVLQRNLEGRDANGSSRAVVIGCVNPSSRDYSQTLRTMDFMTRISAKAGKTAKSPSRDGSSSRPPIAVSSSAKKTPNNHESDGMLLKSIVSDPRQRLAKLLTPQQSANKAGSRNSSQNKSRDIATPRSNSTFSEHMAQQRFRDTYNSVFDQLENLMSTEDEEDDLDRDSYGNKIIQAITPNVKLASKKKMRPAPSPGTETEEFLMSPLYNLTPPVAQRNKGTMKDLTVELQREENPAHVRQGRGPMEKDMPTSVKKATKDAKVNHLPPLFSEIQFQSNSGDGENWNEFSPVSSSQGIGNDNQDVFVEKSKLVPLKTLVSQDSMDSELLVSCRANTNHMDGFASSELDSVDRPKLPTVHYEQVAEEPDVSTIVESLQQEVDALIKESPVSKYRHKDSGHRAGHPMSLPTQGINDDDHVNSDSSLIHEEIVALKSMLDKYKKEKAATDSFLQKLHRIADGTEDDYLDEDTSFPPNCLSLMNVIRKRQAMLVNIQRELNQCKAENLEITNELERSGSPQSIAMALSTEKDLIRAKEIISDQAKKSLALETAINLEKARAKELSLEKAAFGRMLGEIDELLGMEQGVYDSSRQQLRLERMKRMQDGLQKLLTKTQEFERLLNESREEGTKARKLVGLLEAKVSDVQSHANQSQGSSSQAVEAAEKLAEDAIRANESLTTEITQLRNGIARIRDEYQALSQKHQGVVAKNTELEEERERLMSGNEGDVISIRKALEVSKEEKNLLEEQLASFSSKTAEMMKQRIDDVKEEYARRLSVHQARIAELEEERGIQQMTALSSVKNELSQKQSENEHLRIRIEQIENETSVELQNAKSALAQVQTELNRANDEAKTQRDENATLQNELSNLRGIIDVAEQSVNEVNRLRMENEQLLQETIKSQRDQQTLDTSFEVPSEVRGKRNTNNVSFLHDEDDYFMKERVTALMRENEQNNISMRSLQSENIFLKSSVEQCTGTIDVMRSELNDLKSMTSEGMSKMRTRHEKDKVTIAELEKKLESATILIHRLRPSHGGMASLMDEGSTTSRRSTPYAPQMPRRFETSFTPYDATERKINAEKRRFETSFSPYDASEKKLNAELSAEKELRYKAEEICAGVLADAKLGFEERDKEIERLRSKLSKMSRGYL